MAAKKRVLSGMRPTGRLHLGHLVGALENWIRLQDQYQCFFFVADWHALTTDYADTSGITENTRQMVTDWLAAGLDPKKATFFVQSRVPEHAELSLLFSMITPLGWLERVPSYKEQREQIRDKDLGTHGFLGYPVLQAADILMYRAHYVPVGEDQVPHVELTREIARRFNANFGLEISEDLWKEENRQALQSVLSVIRLPPIREKRSERELISYYTTQIRRHAAEVGYTNFIHQLKQAGKRKAEQLDTAADFEAPFPGDPKRFFLYREPLKEPQALLTSTPKLPGLDGRKMSKSYGNVLELADEPDTIRQKVSGMLTDPQRVRRTDPGRPEICPVFGYHRRYSTEEVVRQVDRECRTAAIGCVDCKTLMVSHLLPVLEPIRERRRAYEARPERVGEILTEGSKQARRMARRTMEQVRQAMQMVFDWEGKRRKPSLSPGRAKAERTT